MSRPQTLIISSMRITPGFLCFHVSIKEIFYSEWITKPNWNYIMKIWIMDQSWLLYYTYFWLGNAA